MTMEESGDGSPPAGSTGGVPKGKEDGEAPEAEHCNSPPINGQCSNFILFDVALLPLHSKGLNRNRIEGAGVN